jgi:hypothetical protein
MSFHEWLTQLAELFGCEPEQLLEELGDDLEQKFFSSHYSPQETYEFIRYR